MLALAACAPAEQQGIGPEVTGNAEGYAGGDASVVVVTAPADPTATDMIELGTGSVTGTTIRFSLSPAPEAALLQGDFVDVELSDPEARLAFASVHLFDAQGGFVLGKFASSTQQTVGEVAAMLV